MASAAVSYLPNHQALVHAQKSFPVPPSDNKLHHVPTSLNYGLYDGTTPPAPSYAGRPESFIQPTEAIPTTVTDISGSELDYTLDSHGFQIYYHESKEKGFDDDERIKKEYYPETEQLLKDATGASRVFIFDHTIRRNANEDGKRFQIGGPVHRVHIDQSYKAAKDRVPYHLPEDAPQLLKGRYQIINVWRPIKPIYRDPLAVADAHSVPDSALIPSKIIYPNREGETYGVVGSLAYRWYYRYGQTPTMVTLIKCFDSKTDGRARRSPHSAFTNPETETDDYPPRESIELRALVFHPDDTTE